MNTNIEVSIIVPVRNSEKYLSDCLFSALLQDFDYPFEVIVINNGSNDHSEQIIRHFSLRHKNLRHIITKDLSVGFARKRGVEEAKGKYICFLDSDDMYKLSFVRRMHEAITTTNVDIVNCSYVKIMPSGRISRNILAKKRTYDQVGGVSALLRDFNIRGYMPMKMYRSELIKNTHLPVSSKLIMFEDFLMNFSLYAAARKTITITDPLYFYRKTNESATSNLANNRISLHLKCFAAVRYLAEQ
ncbi:MAG: glycosyltransferase family A protein, partial [Bacilli bacterium]